MYGYYEDKPRKPRQTVRVKCKIHDKGKLHPLVSLSAKDRWILEKKGLIKHRSHTAVKEKPRSEGYLKACEFVGAVNEVIRAVQFIHRRKSCTYRLHLIRLGIRRQPQLKPAATRFLTAANALSPETIREYAADFVRSFAKLRAAHPLLIKRLGGTFTLETPARLQPDQFHLAVKAVLKALISISGNTAIIRSEDGTETRITSDTPLRIVTGGGGGDDLDDGRTAALAKINVTLEKCEIILKATLAAVKLATGIAARKSAAKDGMVKLFTVMGQKFMPQILDYAKYEDAEAYDESRISMGVWRICSAVFTSEDGDRDFNRLNACQTSLNEFCEQTKYPCETDCGDLPLGVPLPINQIAQWFMVEKNDDLVAAIDEVKEKLDAQTVIIGGKPAVRAVPVRKPQSHPHERTAAQKRHSEDVAAVVKEINRRYLAPRNNRSIQEIIEAMKSGSAYKARMKDVRAETWERYASEARRRGKTTNPVN